MNGFFHWFKAGTKMKRWMLLILAGIMFVCYAIAKILVLKEVSFSEIAGIIVLFVIGFTAIVLGLIFSNKRTLEVLIEATDERMENKKNVNINSLIFNKTVYDKGPKVVVIGGGSGLNTVLTGIKNYTSNITAIVAVSDYGNKPSNSRLELNMLPLNDIKDSIVSLSNNNTEIKKLFDYQFTTGKLRGLSFSDIYFSAMNNINGNITDSIVKSNEIINMTGKVIPVTMDEMKICAELENGYLVEEKERIPEVVYEKVTKINRIFLSPSNCKASPGVLEAIKEADSIIIGPGSLYTNVIPNLLINGVSKAIKESKAIKIYVCNIMTEPGQTDNYSVSEHINAIIEHCGDGMIDYCIYDTGDIVPEYIKKYNMEGSDLVEQDLSKVKSGNIKFLKKSISKISDGLIRHDSSAVAASVIELICDDLKFQDKQNDPEYLMMSTKLKSDKRINKIKKSSEKSKKKNKKEKKSKHFGKQSKFSSKYSERIQSIKEADRKQKAKEKKNVKKTR